MSVNFKRKIFFECLFLNHETKSKAKRVIRSAPTRGEDRGNLLQAREFHGDPVYKLKKKSGFTNI